MKNKQLTYPVTRLPKEFIWTIVAICLIPFILSLMGVDFGSIKIPFTPSEIPALSPKELVELRFNTLHGAFTHALLEWSAVVIAIITFGFALVHYRLSGDPTTPIIGVALLCSGFMDAFHTMAAARLINAVADNSTFIPFTWAISRMFNALIMITGVSIFLFGGISRNKLKNNHAFVTVIGLIFVLIAYFVIQTCALSEALPQTMFPDSLIKRPFDAIPLLMFLVAGLVLYPLFYKQEKTVFAHALLISAIPEIATEAHMAFGSSSLFDNHFNIAHFLKIFAYLVPFAGLLFMYRQQNVLVTQMESSNHKLKISKMNIEEKNKELEFNKSKLEDKNNELERFSYIASHDLQEPLRVVASYMQLLQKKYKDQLDEQAAKYIESSVEATRRMKELINGLLEFSRIETQGREEVSINLMHLLSEICKDLGILLQDTNGSIHFDSLPTIKGDPIQINQLFQNIISNGIKFKKETTDPIITISAKPIPLSGLTEISITDNGIGIEEDYFDRIFEIFQRLNTRVEYKGTGIGLAICKKIVERHKGEIWLESQFGKGSSFRFTLPMVNDERLISIIKC